MPVIISDEILRSAHLTEGELKIELAVALFQTERLTLGQAAQLAGMPHLDFQRVLGSRRIPVHYGPEQLEADLERVQGLSIS